MKKRQILLVEDDDMLASLLNYRFKKDGYEVVLKNDGKQVKTWLNNSLPDIIVSDIMMPYFSGIELVDYIRNKLKSTIPIILLSSASNEENILNAFKIGANDFISKPVNPSELLVRISKEISRID